MIYILYFTSVNFYLLRLQLCNKHFFKKNPQQNISLQEWNNRDPIFMPRQMIFSLRSDFSPPSNHTFPVIKLKPWFTACLLSQSHHGGTNPRLSQEAGYWMLFPMLMSVVYFHVCKVRKLDFIYFKSSLTRTAMTDAFYYWVGAQMSWG